MISGLIEPEHSVSKDISLNILALRREQLQRIKRDLCNIFDGLHYITKRNDANLPHTNVYSQKYIYYLYLMY